MKRRETSICSCLSCAPTGDLALNSGMCPVGIEPATLWFAGQHSTTEPHQPGLKVYIPLPTSSISPWPWQPLLFSVFVSLTLYLDSTYQ